jgi:hypothetical protein
LRQISSAPVAVIYLQIVKKKLAQPLMLMSSILLFPHKEEVAVAGMNQLRISQLLTIPRRPRTH